jgi:hypothetical protein
MASEKQRLTGVVTSRTWAVVTTIALLAVGADGLWALVAHGQWIWIELIALLLGLTSAADLVRRWRTP